MSAVVLLCQLQFPLGFEMFDNLLKQEVIFRTFTNAVSAWQNTHSALQALEMTRLVHQFNARSYKTRKPWAQMAGSCSADTHGTYSYQCLHLRHPIVFGRNRYIKYRSEMLLFMSLWRINWATHFGWNWKPSSNRCTGCTGWMWSQLTENILLCNGECLCILLPLKSQSGFRATWLVHWTWRIWFRSFYKLIT